MRVGMEDAPHDLIAVVDLEHDPELLLGVDQVAVRGLFGVLRGVEAQGPPAVGPRGVARDDAARLVGDLAVGVLEHGLGQGRHVLADPHALRAKALDYAKYDFVRVLNKSLDTLGLRGSIVEKVLARTLAVPAERFFRMRRSVSLLVSERPDGTHGLIEGTYQSPILVQWQRAPRQTRVLEATLTELR